MEDAKERPNGLDGIFEETEVSNGTRSGVDFKARRRDLRGVSGG